MLRKTIGTILLIAAGVIAVILLTGGSLFPHIVGPIILAVIGVILLTRRKNIAI